MKRKPIIVLLSLILVLAFWFLTVDFSWFVETCPECGFGRDIVQYRVLTMPVYQRTKDYDSLLSKIASDIGAECTHPQIERWHKQRYWGLLICACPCINGITRLTGGDASYDKKARSLVRDRVKNNPSLQAEIAERVLKNRDWVYWDAFLSRNEISPKEEAAGPQYK